MKNKQLYIIRKYIYADSAKSAIRLDKKTPVQDVWIDDDWKKQQQNIKVVSGYKT